ncbi:hypothetical protein HZC34_05530 [Candidatus Saganbacteria bacterium]|nr:hypothetical protein [Candidatus Saganbacteria bacterium]
MISSRLTEVTGRPVAAKRLGADVRVSRVLFSGFGRRNDLPGALASLAGVDIKAGTQFRLNGHSCVISAVKKDGTPIISHLNLSEIVKTDLDSTFTANFNPDTRILHLATRTRDYFGLFHDMAYAVKESGLDIYEIGVRHQRIGGYSTIDFACPFYDEERVPEAFGKFRANFSERLKAHNSFALDGERLKYTYSDLVDSMGRFLNTFPEVPDMPHLTADEVDKIFVENPAMSTLLVKYLRVKYDKTFSQYYGLSNHDLKSLAMQIRSTIRNIPNAKDRDAARIMFVFLTSIKETNIFDPNRNPEVAIFKLSHKIIQNIADHFKLTYPTDITYVYSPKTRSFAIGSRFGGEVSKGGDRYLFDNPKGMIHGDAWYEASSRKALEESLRLAWTQEVKNILWGCYVNGLKTVLVAYPPVEQDAAFEQIEASISVHRDFRSYSYVRDAILELTGEDMDKTIAGALAEKDQAKAKDLLFRLVQLENLVNLSEAEVYLKNLGDKRPGPDMNMSSSDMNFLSVVAKHMGVQFWPAIYTGKSADFGGFPHKALKITGIGVFVNMLIAIEKLGIDPKQRRVTATVQGFGDVGGAMAYLILNERPDIKLTAISDHTGLLVCEEGFDFDARIKDELLKLAREEKTLDQFSPELLAEFQGKIELRDRSRISEIVTLPSTLFIPSAIGNVINDQNVEEVVRVHELVVEAANIPFVVSAAATFDKLDGRRILDAFANGGGVFTSNNEILSIQVLGQEEFKENFEKLVSDNEALVRRNAEDNSSYVWGEYNKSEGRLAFPTLVKEISHAMTRVKSILKVSSQVLERKEAFDILFASLFPTLLEKVNKDEIIEKLGPAIVRELISGQLARKIVFSNSYDWFEKIPEDSRDAAVLAEANKILDGLKKA